MIAKYYIVIAWLEESRELVRERRTDLGEAPIMRDMFIAKACTWRIVDVDTARATDNGSEQLREELVKAQAFVKKEYGERTAVDIWGAVVKDPLEKSRAALLRAAGVRP